MNIITKTLKALGKVYFIIGLFLLLMAGLFLTFYAFGYLVYLPAVILGLLVYFITGDSTLLDIANSFIVQYNTNFFNLKG
jgi:hypothetical protein